MWVSISAGFVQSVHFEDITLFVCVDLTVASNRRCRSLASPAMD